MVVRQNSCHLHSLNLGSVRLTICLTAEWLSGRNLKLLTILLGRDSMRTLQVGWQEIESLPTEHASHLAHLSDHYVANDINRSAGAERLVNGGIVIRLRIDE